MPLIQYCLGTSDNTNVMLWSNNKQSIVLSLQVLHGTNFNRHSTSDVIKFFHLPPCACYEKYTNEN